MKEDKEPINVGLSFKKVKVPPNKKMPTSYKLYRTLKIGSKRKKMMLDFFELEAADRRLRSFTEPLPPNVTYLDVYVEVGEESERVVLNWYHIKSLDPYISLQEEFNVIKSLIPTFVCGWLYDACIDGFLTILTQLSCENRKLSYISSIVPHALHTHYPDNPSASPDIAIIREKLMVRNLAYVFMPLNIRGSHWTVIIAAVREKQIWVLDPDSDRLNDGVSDLKIWYAKLIQDEILLGLHMEYFPILSPRHTLQTDTMSCGVYILWYCDQISNNDQITGSFDVDEYRNSIYTSFQYLRNRAVRV